MSTWKKITKEKWHDDRLCHLKKKLLATKWKCAINVIKETIQISCFVATKQYIHMHMAENISKIGQHVIKSLNIFRWLKIEDKKPCFHKWKNT
jgi:hypothetical protein